jgi:hypothetical protein
MVSTLRPGAAVQEVFVPNSLSHDQGGVRITASQAAGVLVALTIDVAAAGITVAAQVRNGNWHLKTPQTELSTHSFEAVWDAIPKAVRADDAHPWISITPALAEIVDRHGRLTAPGLGYSLRSHCAESAYAEMMDCYGGDCGVAFLRRIAAIHGYKMAPDPAIIADRPGCHAYHELVGAIYDAMVEDGPVCLQDLLEASDCFGAFQEQLDAASPAGGRELRAEESI